MEKRILAITASLKEEASNLPSWELLLKWLEQHAGYKLIPHIETKLIIKGPKGKYIMQSCLRQIVFTFSNPDFIFVECEAIVNNRLDQAEHTFEYVSEETRCNIHLIADWREAITILQNSVTIAATATDEAEVTQ